MTYDIKDLHVNIPIDETLKTEEKQLLKTITNTKLNK